MVRWFWNFSRPHCNSHVHSFLEPPVNEARKCTLDFLLIAVNTLDYIIVVLKVLLRESAEEKSILSKICEKVLKFENGFIGRWL